MFLSIRTVPYRKSLILSVLADPDKVVVFGGLFLELSRQVTHHLYLPAAASLLHVPLEHFVMCS